MFANSANEMAIGMTTPICPNGNATAVVSMPCTASFDQNSEGQHLKPVLQEEMTAAMINPICLYEKAAAVL